MTGIRDEIQARSFELKEVRMALDATVKRRVGAGFNMRTRRPLSRSDGGNHRHPGILM